MNENTKQIWYAVRTLNCKEKRLGEYLARNNLKYFIPMCYKERTDWSGKKSCKLVPAVHNLVFLMKTMDYKTLKALVDNSPVPFLLLRHHDTKQLCEIKEHEMVELRAICDPEYKGTIYVDISEVGTTSGTLVRVKHGAFKGLTGKLTRYRGKYYIVVTIISLGVMIHIPRWYCEKLE